MSTVKADSWHKNSWVLGMISLIGVVLIVNLGMIYLAVVTSPGLVTTDYYEQGKHYFENSTSRRQMRQQLNWQVTLLQPETKNQQAQFHLQVIDQENNPVHADKVELLFYRPSNAKSDFSQNMKSIQPGQYQADVQFSLKGVWDLIAIIHQGEKQYDIARRILI